MGREETHNKLRGLAEHRTEEFVENGKKVIIKCSNCDEELVEIWIVRPNAEITSNIVAECPHCNDKSFMQTIDGQFCIGKVESGRTLLVNIPTTYDTSESGMLVQNILIKTEKGEI